MGFLAPHWLWLLLLAVPIVALYTRRTRRPRVRVPSLRLWTGLEGVRAAPRWRVLGRLDERWLALALFLLALGGSVLGLARPGGGGAAPRDVVLVVDVGARMAVVDGAPPRARLERAQEALAAVEVERGPGRRWVVAAGAPARVLATPDEPLPPLALEGGATDLPGALALAREALASVARVPGEAAPEVWALAVDAAEVDAAATAGGAWPPGVALRRVSLAAAPGPRQDLALSGALTRVDAEHVRLRLEVTNRGRAPCAARVEVRLDGAPLVSEPPRPLDPGQRLEVGPRDLATPRGGLLEARVVGGSDGQPLDDALAWVVPPPGRLSVTLHDPDGDRFLRAALAADPQVVVHASGADPAPDASVSVLVATSPPGGDAARGGSWAGAVWLGPGALGGAELDLALEGEQDVGLASPRLEADAPAAGGAGDGAGPDLSGLDLEERVVHQAARVRPGASWRVLARAGEGPDAPPLLLARDVAGRREVALTFAPARSDLVLGRAFPLLLARAVRWVARHADTEPRWTRAGESARVGAGAASAVARGGAAPAPAFALALAPDDRPVPLAALPAEGGPAGAVMALERGPGVYRVPSADDREGAQLVAAHPVELPADVACEARAGTPAAPGDAVPRPGPAHGRDAGRLCVLLAVLALAVEAALFHLRGLP